MNLTGRDVYIKGSVRKKNKRPTTKHYKLWEIIRALGCAVDKCERKPIEIHHCFTGAGRRKDHKKVIPLCHFHHRGEEGIHTISRKKWQIKFGTEEFLLVKIASKLL